MEFKRIAPLLLAAIMPLLHGQASAQTPRRDALNLSATATQEVSRDVLSLVFSTTKEGADAGAVQAALKQALDVALTEARRIAKPGLVEVQTGVFSLYPRYAPKGGNISGWQGSAELVVEGRDATAIAQLSGRISTLSIARVGWGLSREAREKVEAELVAQAISRYRARAADYARQFGYSGYSIGEVSVNTQDSTAPMPMAAAGMRYKSSALVEDALPVEAGKASVSVTVSGVVQMGK